MMPLVFKIGEQFGKSPDEVVEWDTATFMTIMIYNNQMASFQKALHKVKSEK